MASFIKCSSITGPVLINIDDISYIEPVNDRSNGKTYIYFMRKEDQRAFVLDTVDEVEVKINEKQSKNFMFNK